MSSDPFNFGPSNEFPAARPSAPPSGPGAPANPFAGSVPNNPLSAAHPQAPAPVFTPTQPTHDLTAATPPAWLLFAAAGLALVAGIVALILNSPFIAIVCWLLAGPVAIGLLALFVTKDNFARSSGLYAAQGWVRPLHFAAIGICLLCILAPALRIADWVGHL